MARKEIYEPNVLREVARWYHEEFLLKIEMRERLRQKYGRDFDDRAIDRILIQAAERGAVKIHYPKTLLDGQLSEKLCRKYPDRLLKVIVVGYDSDRDSYDDLLAMWGHAAARYFDELVAASDRTKALHIGISGGETLMAFAASVSERKRPTVHIHTLALIGCAEGAALEPFIEGKVPQSTPTHVDPLVNAEILFSKCGRSPGRCHFVTVPPSSATTRRGILEELHKLAKHPNIENALKWMDSVTVAFAGLGMIRGDMRDPQRANQLSMTGLVSSIVPPEQLQREKAAGDLSYNFF